MDFPPGTFGTEPPDFRASGAPRGPRRGSSRKQCTIEGAGREVTTSYRNLQTLCHPANIQARLCTRTQLLDLKIPQTTAHEENYIIF